MNNHYKYNQQEYFKITGKIIKKLRLKQNYTIPQISLKSNVPQNIREKIENADITEEITLNHLYCIAKSLNTTLYNIFIEVENVLEK